MAFAFDAVTQNVLNVAMTEIQKIAQLLDDGSEGIDAVHFDDNPAQPAHFGGSYSGKMLGYEHYRAHKVMAATLKGVMTDLRDFHDGMIQAATTATDADEQSAAEIARLQELGRLNNTKDETGEAKDEQADTTPAEVEPPPATDPPPTTPPTSDTPPAGDPNSGEGEK